MILNQPYVLAEIKQVTPTVTSYVFKSQNGASIDFTPGMFAMLQYKDPSSGESVSRAFSMANAPPSDHLEFLISLIHGKLTSKLEVAKPGDVYYISAPYGQFKFVLDAGNKILFLAGGTGIAPFLSMLRFVKDNNKSVDCKLIYSVKFPAEIIDKVELDEMSTTLGLKTAVTITRPTEGDRWTGDTGHVNKDMILKYASDLKERISYICGPPAFVKAVKDALTELGVDQKKIKAEMWG